MANLRIMSYNVQGLQSSEKRMDVFDYLKDKNNDIYYLQDTHFTDENEYQIIDKWGNSNSHFSNFKSNARGVAILFNNNLDYKIQQKIIDNSGNFIILDLDIQNQHLTLINPYGPNVDNPEFFKKISSYIDDIGNTDIIICGDYNCVINPELDYYNYKGIDNAKARNEVLNLKNEKFLIDAFRENCPTTKNSPGERKVPLNKQD